MVLSNWGALQEREELFFHKKLWRNMSERLDAKRKEWSEKVEQWRRSAKSAQAWCRENQVVYTTFIAWRKRLKLDSEDLMSYAQSPFIELKDKDNSGVCLECAGVKIHLSNDFDAALLKKCLSILQGASC